MLKNFLHIFPINSKTICNILYKKRIEAMWEKTYFCLRYTKFFYGKSRNIHKTAVDFRALKF